MVCLEVNLLKVPRRRGWHLAFRICPRQGSTFRISLEPLQQAPTGALDLLLLYHGPLEIHCLRSVPAQELLELGSKNLKTFLIRPLRPPLGVPLGEDLSVSIQQSCIWRNWHKLEDDDGDKNPERGIGMRNEDVAQK